MSLRVVVPPHPLIAHWLTVLRNSTTPSPLYSTGLEELGKWLTYEAIREWIPYKSETIKTHQTTTEGTLINAEIPLLVIPTLPGGLELWNGAKQVLPNVHKCLGDFPKSVESNEGVIIFIDQLASGKRLLAILKHLENFRVEGERIRVITVLTSSPGLQLIAKEFPEITIHSACIDPELSENGEIIPGIGNPSLRLNTRFEGPN